jgi:uncharacterized protein YicC (UPF0701 family)
MRGYLQAQPAQNTAARQRMPDAALLAELGTLDAAVRSALPQAAPLSVAEVLRWPGVLGRRFDRRRAVAGGGAGTLRRPARRIRRQPGSAKAPSSPTCCATARRACASASPPPNRSCRQRWRPTANAWRPGLREAVATLDEDRIRQEVGVFAAKIDVAEEIARLVTHMDELDRGPEKRRRASASGWIS